MRVFVAGASGAIGRPLVRQLRGGGARGDGDDPARGAGGGDPGGRGRGGGLRRLRRGGAGARRSWRRAPEAVVHALTALPRALRPEERLPGGDQPDPGRGHAQPGRRRAGRGGAADGRREHRLRLPARRATGSRTRRRRCSPTRRAASASPSRRSPTLERAGRSRADGIEGLVLRFGWLYGPGTYYDRGGSAGRRSEQAPLPDRRQGHRHLLLHPRRRRGRARSSPRSSAALPASTTWSTTSRRRCASGCRSTREALGAKPPRRVPVWLARLVAGKDVAALGGRTARRQPTPRPGASWAGSRPTRAGARASATRSPTG